MGQDQQGAGEDSGQELRTVNPAPPMGGDKGWEFRPLWSLTEAQRVQCMEMSPDSFFDLPQPGLGASSPNISCRHFPLLVSSSLLRVDLFNGLLGPVEVTALYVTRLDNVTVAHMGTADGRILQVGPSSLRPLVPGPLSLFCSWPTCPRWSWPGLSTTCCTCPTSHWAAMGSPCIGVSDALGTTCSLPLGTR